MAELTFEILRLPIRLHICIEAPFLLLALLRRRLLVLVQGVERLLGAAVGLAERVKVYRIFLYLRFDRACVAADHHRLGLHICISVPLGIVVLNLSCLQLRSQITLPLLSYQLLIFGSFGNGKLRAGHHTTLRYLWLLNRTAKLHLKAATYSLSVEIRLASSIAHLADSNEARLRIDARICVVAAEPMATGIAAIPVLRKRLHLHLLILSGLQSPRVESHLLLLVRLLTHA